MISRAKIRLNFKKDRKSCCLKSFFNLIIFLVIAATWDQSHGSEDAQCWFECKFHIICVFWLFSIQEADRTGAEATSWVPIKSIQARSSQAIPADIQGNTAQLQAPHTRRWSSGHKGCPYISYLSGNSWPSMFRNRQIHPKHTPNSLS